MYDFPAIINETEWSKGAIKADKNETNLGRMMMIMMRVEMKMLKLIFFMRWVRINIQWDLSSANMQSKGFNIFLALNRYKQTMELSVNPYSNMPPTYS